MLVSKLKQLFEFKPGGKLKVNQFQAIFIISLVVLWFASGVISKLVRPPEEVESVKQLLLPHVGVLEVNAQPYKPFVNLRATTEASVSVNLSSKIRATVLRVPVKQGQAVRKGQVVCELQSLAAEADLRQARTGFQRAELEYQGTVKLHNKGIASDLSLKTATVAFDSAKSMLARAVEGMNYTRIAAPANGIVDRIHLDPGDLVRPDGICASFVAPDPMLLIGFAAEREVGLLKPDALVDVQFIDGSQAQGVITFVSRVSDSSSRSYRIEARMPNPSGVVRNGMTVDMRAYGSEIVAHYIRTSVLTLNTEGRLGVRMVQPASNSRTEGSVTFLPVKIVGGDRQGVWVVGMSDGLLISVGTDFVSAGDRVRYDSIPGDDRANPEVSL